MLAIVLLGLIAAENASAFKFRKVHGNHDKGIKNLNSARDNHKIDVINIRKANIIIRQGNIDNEIININRQQEDLNRQMENIKKQKDELQKKAEFLTRQKEQLEREMEKLNADIKLINGHERNHADGIVEGNEFKITIHLSNYKEEDIVVKSKRGLLIVQAHHNVSGEPTKKYFNVISLPDFVEGYGRWIYTWGVLQIVFPIIESRNKYPKLMVPLGNEEFSETEIGKPNTAYQNVAYNIEVPNEEVEIKSFHNPDEDNHVEAIK